MAESDAADNALMLKGVDEINIKHTRHFWVENGKPICLDLLLVCGETLKVQLRQCIANSVVELGVLASNLMARDLG